MTYDVGVESKFHYLDCVAIKGIINNLILEGPYEFNLSLDNLICFVQAPREALDATLKGCSNCLVETFPGYTKRTFTIKFH